MCTSIASSFRCWILLLTGNIYWSDPELLPVPPHLLLPICYSVYLILLAHFLLSIRHTSHCLPRYARSPKVLTNLTCHCLPRYALLGWAHAAVLFLGGQAALSNLTLRHGMVSRTQQQVLWEKFLRECNPPSNPGMDHLCLFDHHDQRHSCLHVRLLLRANSPYRAEPS